MVFATGVGAGVCIEGPDIPFADLLPRKPAEVHAFTIPLISYHGEDALIKD